MVEWRRRSTRIRKILCSNLSVIIYGMTLDKSLKGELSQMTHSYRANASSVSTLDGRGADTTFREKKKTVATGRMWTLLITAVDPNGSQAYKRLLLLYYDMDSPSPLKYHRDNFSYVSSKVMMYLVIAAKRIWLFLPLVVVILV